MSVQSFPDGDLLSESNSSAYEAAPHAFLFETNGIGTLGGTETKWVPTFWLTVKCWLWALNPTLTRALFIGKAALLRHFATAVLEEGMRVGRCSVKMRSDVSSATSLQGTEPTKIFLKSWPGKNDLKFFKKQQKACPGFWAVLKCSFQSTAILEPLSKDVVQFVYVLVGT